MQILQQGLKNSRKPLGILAFFAVLSTIFDCLNRFFNLYLYQIGLLAIASLVYFADSISLPGDDST